MCYLRTPFPESPVKTHAPFRLLFLASALLLVPPVVLHAQTGIDPKSPNSKRCQNSVALEKYTIMYLSAP
jgi:hypothetical protein